MSEQCLVLADSPRALIRCCGISGLERLLRTLQRSGCRRVVVLSNAGEAIARELAGPSWARSELDLIIATRPAGAVRIEHLADNWPEGSKLLPIFSAGTVLEQRLVRLLLSENEPAALIDSAAPPPLDSLVASALATRRGKLCGAALLSPDWVRSRTGPFEEALRAGLEDRTLAEVDVAAQPLYYAPLNRKLRPYWFPAPSPDHAALAKRIILDSAQKGTLDLPATVHGPIETFVVARLCETPVTPNQLTLITNVVAWSATVLLATGRLGWGLVLAVIVGVLDGLDGKQARVKVETTRHGKLEHWFDAFFEISWWTALAYYLHRSGQLPHAYGYFALLLFAQGLDGILKSGVRFVAGKSIEELGPFERLVHFVGGRRNVMVWIQTIGFLLGSTAKTFMILPWLVLLTAILHLPRALSLFYRAYRKADNGNAPFVRP